MIIFKYIYIYFNYFYFNHLDFEHILLIHYPRIIFFKYSPLKYGIFIDLSSYIKLSEYGEAIPNENLISSNIAIK